jgi:hypothetical protein
MGWPSYLEDIQDRRLERDVSKTFDELITKARDTKTLKELQIEQGECEDLSRRIVEFLESRKQDALEALREATKIFSDPNARVMAPLGKRERDLKAIREKLHATEINLQRSRTKGKELEAKVTNERRKNAELEATNTQLRDLLAYYEAMHVAIPLRRVKR